MNVRTSRLNFCANGKGGPLALAVAFSMVLVFGTIGQAWAKEYSAEALFMQIPASVFDNTYQPLTESEKETLIINGYTHNWVLTYSDNEMLRFNTTTLDYNKLTVRLFKGKEGGVMVLSTETPQGCLTEFWEFDAYGGLVPGDGPVDPLPQDFFAMPQPLSKEVTPTYNFCLVGNTLEANMSFWNDSGIILVTPTNKVLYTWDGAEFVKSVQLITVDNPTQPAIVPDTVLTGTPKLQGTIDAVDSGKKK